MGLRHVQAMLNTIVHGGRSRASCPSAAAMRVFAPLSVLCALHLLHAPREARAKGVGGGGGGGGAGGDGFHADSMEASRMCKSRWLR